VLDAGSGSGILAVERRAARRRRAIGFDVDPDAKPYADALARERRAGPLALPSRRGSSASTSSRSGFDGLAANLYADAVGAEIGRLARAIRRDGWFVFSGCTEVRSAGLSETISGSSLQSSRNAASGRWRTYIGTRIRG
jgi:ribosomal protein L11 methylase PrmA